MLNFWKFSKRFRIFKIADISLCMCFNFFHFVYQIMRFSSVAFDFQVPVEPVAMFIWVIDLGETILNTPSMV